MKRIKNCSFLPRLILSSIRRPQNTKLCTKNLLNTQQYVIKMNSKQLVLSYNSNVCLVACESSKRRR